MQLTAQRKVSEDHGKKNFFSRMKESAVILSAIAAFGLTDCSKSQVSGNQPVSSVQAPQQLSSGAETDQARPQRPERFEIPARALFDFGPTTGMPNNAYCTMFPEIDQWAAMRNIDPILVRAFVLTESGFDPNAAAQVCSRNTILSNGAPGCFPADLSGNSAGYSRGYDEMYAPSGVARFATAPNSGTASPDWRWLAFGLMMAVEPPFTFWPASHHPDGIDGQYFDIYARSGLYPLNLNAARECNPNFNPFNPGDSACLGTGRMRSMINNALAWINANRSLLNWGLDLAKDRAFAGYIAGNMYDGVWESRNRVNHPRCSTSSANGDCWADGFARSWSVTTEYCGSGEGQQDAERCSNGSPRVFPPERCYGYTDFVRYVRDCEVPYLARPADPGRAKMQAYYSLRNSCP
jgi:hypothetical protein